MAQETQTAAETRLTENIGLVVVAALVVVLGMHPPGTTSLYDDGIEFTEHVTTFWVIIHLLSALLLLVVPLLVTAWTAGLSAPSARVVGRLLGTTSVIAVAIGALHVVATDTIVFEFFSDTLESDAPAAATVADGLLRLHAATLTAWALTMLVSLPALAAAAAWLDGRRKLEFWVPAFGASFGAASVILTVSEGQYTTLSEMGLLRPSATLLVIWLLLISYNLRHHGE